MIVIASMRPRWGGGQSDATSKACALTRPEKAIGWSESSLQRFAYIALRRSQESGEVHVISSNDPLPLGATQ